MALSAVIICCKKSCPSSPWGEEVGVRLGCFQMEGTVFLALENRREKREIVFPKINQNKVGNENVQ